MNYLSEKYLPGPNFKYIALHTLMWGALLGLPYLFSSSSGQSIDTDVLPQYFFTVTNSLHAALFYLNAYWMQPRLFRRGRRWQYAFAILTLIAASVYLKVLLFQVGVFPLHLESFMFPILFFPTVLFTLISIVYRMVLDRINVENEQLKSELKFLRSQVSPHFLFNVLNNMVSMARKKSDQLEPSLIKLAGLMRYMLQDSADQQVPLAKQVTYLENYIELQKIRYSDDVEVHVCLTGQTNKHKIEPMLLIPFVENAFKHGIGLIENPRIDVTLSVNEEILTFEVVNDFDEKDRQKDISSGIGLNNVIKRLNILYPGQHQLEITRLESTFKVNLTLTLQ